MEPKSFSLSRMISELKLKKLILLWVIMVLVFSGIYYSLAITDKENNYIMKNGTKADGYLDYLLFSSSISVRFWQDALVSYGLVMKFLAVIQMIISFILICAIISRAFFVAKTKKIESVYERKVTDRQRYLLKKLRSLKQETSKKLGLKNYRSHLLELSKMVIDKKASSEFIAITDEVIETLNEKRSIGLDSADDIYSIAILSEDIIERADSLKEKQETLKNIERLKDRLTSLDSAE